MVGPVGLVPNGIASRPALALSHLQSLRQTHFVVSTPLASLCSKSSSSRWWARWGWCLTASLRDHRFAMSHLRFATSNPLRGFYTPCFALLKKHLFEVVGPVGFEPTTKGL